ncbi:MAG: DUF7309 domain-containing protein [Candidatus Binatia bacterium]
MDVPSVSIQVWKNLYHSALRFRENECWDWMEDTDIFGVQNPESGEIGYCCVLGKLREVFGLVVYLGTQGLEGYRKIQSGEVDPGDIESLFLQNCLRVFFEDRDQLAKPDLDVIRKLRLRLRRGNAWPHFRSLRSGYFPWYLTEGEASYLKLALQQATVVAPHVAEESDFLTAPRENHYLVRVPIKTRRLLS